ncbi:MAG: amidohydrolase [Clostridia bacterium]|nr:amidohydrolase [Clostridia bacterium]
MKTIYINGAVYTGELPLCSAFSVQDGRFVQTGDDSALLATRRAGDEVIDLQGRFVCAGFNDSHMHLLGFGQSLTMAPLHRHTRSLADMLDALRNFLRERPPLDGWLLGRGWNQDYFADEKRLPTRHDLDRVSAEIPIYITRACGHIACANTRAIELAGVTPDTPCPEGGRFDVGEDGRLTGIFRENARRLITDRMPQPSPESIRRMIDAAARELNRYGITSCQTDDFCVYPELDSAVVLDAFRALAEEGALRVRVNEQAHFCDAASLRAFLDAGYHTGVGDAFFRIGPLKMLGDGSLGARTAYMSRPYADAPDTLGIPVYTRAQFDEMISLAHRNRMQVAIHAIGDGILDDILDAYERALTECPREDHRHGIVHCQITRPDQLERMRRMRLHAYVQSIFLDYDNHIVAERVGADRAATSYAFRTLLTQYHASNGSDCPVELPNVLAGIQCGVTRQTLSGGPAYRPEEAFSVQQALDTFTREGAFASFEEDVKGRIAPGMYADFVVLSDNPFDVDPHSIRDIRVLQTVLDGRTMYLA